MAANDGEQALHLTVDARPETVDAAEALLARHAGVLNGTPRARALTVLRVKDAPRLYLVARWATEGAVGERPGARDTLLAELQASSEDLLTAPPRVDGCAVLADEVGLGGDGPLPPGGAGWQFHVTVEAQPGHEAIYERWKVEEGERQRFTPGFRRRLLLRSDDRPQLFFYQSFWDSEEQARAFGSTPAFQALMREIDPNGAMVRPQLLEECDLRFDAQPVIA